MNNSLKSIRSRGILDVLMGLWHQQMGQRYERLQVALSTKLAFPPTVRAFIRDEQQRARPYLVTMGPFDTAVVEPPAGLGRFVVDLQARVCTCQEFQMRKLPCSHALVTIDIAGKHVAGYIPHHHMLTIDLAGKQVADYIPYHHTLTCWQDTYKYNMRPIAFEIPKPKYQSTFEAQDPTNEQATDEQPTESPVTRLPTVHEARPTPPEMALAADNCHPPIGQFAAAIGKRKTARFEKGKTQSRATGRKEQHCTSCGGVGHNSRSCGIRTYKNTV